MSTSGSEVSHHLDLDVLRYSRVEEDCGILADALDIQAETDIVLSITSSGDNVLNLLLERPRKIIALDFSPTQNYVLELKIAAIVHLTYEEYLQLLGEVECDSDIREKIYIKIEKDLPDKTQRYWRSNLELLRSGLSRGGRLQVYLYESCVQFLQENISHDLLRAFLEAKNLDDQNLIFNKLPQDKLKESIRRVITNQEAGRSEAQLKYVSLSMEDRIEKSWEHFISICRNCPIRDNFYLCQYLTGRKSTKIPIPQYCFPPYLTKEGFTSLKTLVDRIEIITSSIEDYMNITPTVINKMNLSDIFEYMDEKSTEEMFQFLSNKMAPGARIAFWNLYNDRLPSKKNSSLKHLTDLSQRLFSQDRLWFYKSFHVVEKSV